MQHYYDWHWGDNDEMKHMLQNKMLRHTTPWLIRLCSWIDVKKEETQTPCVCCWLHTTSIWGGLESSWVSVSVYVCVTLNSTNEWSFLPLHLFITYEIVGEWMRVISDIVTDWEVMCCPCYLRCGEQSNSIWVQLHYNKLPTPPPLFLSCSIAVGALCRHWKLHLPWPVLLGQLYNLRLSTYVLAL